MVNQARKDLTHISNIPLEEYSGRQAGDLMAPLESYWYEEQVYKTI